MDPLKKDLYTAKRPSGLDTTSPAVKEAIDSLRSDDNPTNWILLKVSSASAVEVLSTGVNGLQELHQNLNDDDIFYGAIRCVVGGKIKFFHLFFVGTNVSGMKKGKASMYKSAIFQLIEAHGEVSSANGLPEFGVDVILAGIKKLTNSSDISF